MCHLSMSQRRGTCGECSEGRAANVALGRGAKRGQGMGYGEGCLAHKDWVERGH